MSIILPVTASTPVSPAAESRVALADPYLSDLMHGHRVLHGRLPSAGVSP